MHECRYHHVVVQQYEEYSVVRFFCICDRQWEIDVMRITELAAEETIALTVEGVEYAALIK